MSCMCKRSKLAPEAFRICVKSLANTEVFYKISLLYSGYSALLCNSRHPNLITVIYCVYCFPAVLKLGSSLVF